MKNSRSKLVYCINSHQENNEFFAPLGLMFIKHTKGLFILSSYMQLSVLAIIFYRYDFQLHTKDSFRKSITNIFGLRKRILYSMRIVLKSQLQILSEFYCHAVKFIDGTICESRNSIFPSVLLFQYFCSIFNLLFPYISSI